MKTICERGAEIESDRKYILEPSKNVMMLECNACKMKYHVTIRIEYW